MEAANERLHDVHRNLRRRLRRAGRRIHLAAECRV